MASKKEQEKPAKKKKGKGMQKCSLCGKEVLSTEFFAHRNAEHPEQAAESRRKGGKRKAKAPKVSPGNGRNNAPEDAPKKDGPVKPSGGRVMKVLTGDKIEANLVEAAMVEFIGQSIQIPNTPALIYGFFCARKMGFEGSLGKFLQEVIDDFFESRHINYYKEALGWQESGKTLSPDAKPETAEVLEAAKA